MAGVGWSLWTSVGLQSYHKRAGGESSGGETTPRRRTGTTRPRPPAATEPFADALLDAALALRAALDVENETAFSYYLHHDATNAVYRRLQTCTVMQFDWDLTGDHVVEYAFVLHTDDGAIDEAAPA